MKKLLVPYIIKCEIQAGLLKLQLHSLVFGDVQVSNTVRPTHCFSGQGTQVQECCVHFVILHIDEVYKPSKSKWNIAR
jgi:hypothetical protein